jgi:uncharacterized DUF497 family protein
MRFEWDPAKNARNFRKHGVWFEEAQTSWADPRAVEFFDPDHGADEDRYLRIGRSTRDRLLLVVFCERREGAVVRIISARRATAREEAQHEEGV